MEQISFSKILEWKLDMVSFVWWEAICRETNWSAPLKWKYRLRNLTKTSAFFCKFRASLLVSTMKKKKTAFGWKHLEFNTYTNEHSPSNSARPCLIGTHSRRKTFTRWQEVRLLDFTDSEKLTLLAVTLFSAFFIPLSLLTDSGKKCQCWTFQHDSWDSVRKWVAGPNVSE